jgi:hypothetical protein
LDTFVVALLQGIGKLGDPTPAGRVCRSSVL